MVLDQLAGVGLLANLLRDPAHPSVPLGTPSMARMHQHEGVGVAQAGHHHTCEPETHSGFCRQLIHSALCRQHTPLESAPCLSV